MDVTAGEEGSLPATETTVTAAEAGEDKYEWKISGPLKSGKSTITFKSEGKEAFHLLGAVQLVGKASRKEILKAFEQEGPPPKFLDEKTFTTTTVIDGEKSQVTQFNLSKPGKWVLFCPVSDRGEDEPHTKEGLLKVVDVE
jgi:hypothetical protein